MKRSSQLHERERLHRPATLPTINLRVGPTFRASCSRSKHHLSTFWSNRFDRVYNRAPPANSNSPACHLQRTTTPHADPSSASSPRVGRRVDEFSPMVDAASPMAPASMPSFLRSHSTKGLPSTAASVAIRSHARNMIENHTLTKPSLELLPSWAQGTSGISSFSGGTGAR